MITPLLYTLALAAMMLIAVTISVIVDVRRSRKAAAVARQLGLQFSRPDRFLLAPRVAARLPIPGAAEVRIRDVAYTSLRESAAPRDPSSPSPSPSPTSCPGLLCVMTASFTIGSTGHRRNVRRVCAALDPGGAELREFHMLDEPPSPQAYQHAYQELRNKLN